VKNPAIILGVFASVLSTSLRAADDWHFLLAPYVWFAGVEGDITTLPGAPASHIDVSATDALKDTEASFMLMFEAKKGRHGMLFDVFYSDVLNESETNTEYELRLNASMQNTMVTAGYIYELHKSQHTEINAFAGLRYWEVDTQLHFRYGSGTPQRMSFHNSESWLDPMAGAEAKIRLGDSPVYLSGFLGAGGASGGSDSFYDVSAHVGYKFTDSIVTSVGYRIFDVDYQDDGFVYDVKQAGWSLGLVWVFDSR